MNLNIELHSPQVSIQTVAVTLHFESVFVVHNMSCNVVTRQLRLSMLGCELAFEHSTKGFPEENAMLLHLSNPGNARRWAHNRKHW